MQFLAYTLNNNRCSVVYCRILRFPRLSSSITYTGVAIVLSTCKSNIVPVKTEVKTIYVHNAK